MKKVFFCCITIVCCLVSVAQNKKLIIGNWLVEKMESGGKEVFNRNNNSVAFETYKKMFFADTILLARADSLKLLQVIQETKKTIGSLGVGFDAAGNHTTSSFDEKTKKMSTSKGVYKFADGNENKLMIRMGDKANEYEPVNIILLTADTLTFTEETSGRDEAMTITFKRQPAIAKKTAKRR